MLQGVFGFIEASQNHPWPLALDGRVHFRTKNVHTLGYFSLLAPIFQTYARRDSSSDIEALNVLIVLRLSDFEPVMAALAARREEIQSLPRSWRDFLGEIHPPRGAPAIQLEPLLFRNRAIATIDKIESSLKIAAGTGRCLVYGSGVLYRHLCGISLPPDTVEYS